MNWEDMKWVRVFFNLLFSFLEMKKKKKVVLMFHLKEEVELSLEKEGRKKDAKFL